MRKGIVERGNLKPEGDTVFEKWGIEERGWTRLARWEEEGWFPREVRRPVVPQRPRSNAPFEAVDGCSSMGLPRHRVADQWEDGFWQSRDDLWLWVPGRWRSGEWVGHRMSCAGRGSVEGSGTLTQLAIDSVDVTETRPPVAAVHSSTPRTSFASKQTLILTRSLLHQLHHHLRLLRALLHHSSSSSSS